MTNAIRNVVLTVVATMLLGSTAATAGPLYSVTDLGSLGTRSGADSINNSGQIVGFSYLDGGVTPVHATLFSAGGSPIDLGTLGGIYSFANAINSRGQIVGLSTSTTSISGADPFHATLFSAGGAPTELGTLGGIYSVAYAINARGQIVGDSSTSGYAPAYATLWNGGTPIELGNLGGTFSSAIAINNSGQIVGSSYLSGNTAEHATLFIPGGSPIDLGTAGGTTYSEAFGINAGGQIVGESFNPLPDLTPGVYATLWDGGVPFDLNTLLDSSGMGWQLDTANAINDRGQIVGEGYNSAGQDHAFLLTSHAVPEPAALPLFASGLGALGLLGWRRKRRSWLRT